MLANTTLKPTGYPPQTPQCPQLSSSDKGKALAEDICEISEKFQPSQVRDKTVLSLFERLASSEETTADEKTLARLGARFTHPSTLPVAHALAQNMKNGLTGSLGVVLGESYREAMAPAQVNGGWLTPMSDSLAADNVQAAMLMTLRDHEASCTASHSRPEELIRASSPEAPVTDIARMHLIAGGIEAPKSTEGLLAISEAPSASEEERLLSELLTGPLYRGHSPETYGETTREMLELLSEPLSGSFVNTVADFALRDPRSGQEPAEGEQFPAPLLQNGFRTIVKYSQLTDQQLELAQGGANSTIRSSEDLAQAVSLMEQLQNS